MGFSFTWMLFCAKKKKSTILLRVNTKCCISCVEVGFTCGGWGWGLPVVDGVYPWWLDLIGQVLLMQVL